MLLAYSFLSYYATPRVNIDTFFTIFKVTLLHTAKTRCILAFGHLIINGGSTLSYKTRRFIMPLCRGDTNIFCLCSAGGASFVPRARYQKLQKSRI